MNGVHPLRQAQGERNIQILRFEQALSIKFRWLEEHLQGLFEGAWRADAGGLGSPEQRTEP